jgi:hypothetical protein
MKKLKALLALMIATSLVACGGGGGGNTSTGGVYFTHAQLASEFVRRVNIDLGWDVELVKTNTLQYDYIVVYDWDYNTYDAYWLGNYNPGESLSSYVNWYNHKFYYDLVPETGNTYYDVYTGVRFEKTGLTSKNLSTAKAIRENVIIGDAALRVQAKYGLSEEKALDVARFAYKIQTSPEGTFKLSDYDNFAKELTGSTITDFQKDFKEGNLVSLTERIQKAAETTGMGIEQTNNIIKDIFMK